MAMPQFHRGGATSLNVIDAACPPRPLGALTTAAKHRDWRPRGDEHTVFGLQSSTPRRGSSGSGRRVHSEVGRHPEGACCIGGVVLQQWAHHRALVAASHEAVQARVRRQHLVQRAQLAVELSLKAAQLVEAQPELVRRMAGIGCTLEEMAAVVGVSWSTLQERIKTDPQGLPLHVLHNLSAHCENNCNIISFLRSACLVKR